MVQHKKISILVALYLAENSGATRVVQSLIDQLPSDGFDIILVVPQEVPLPFKVRSSITIRHVPIPRMSPRVWFSFNNGIASLVHLSKILRDESVDMVHCVSLPNVLPAIVARCLGIPLVWHVHELEIRPRLIFTTLLMLCQFLADRIICVSDSVARLFPTSSKVQVIYNGVTASYLEPISMEDVLASREKFGLINENFVVTILGRIVPIKGIEWFIRLAEELIHRNKCDINKVKFLIVGGQIEGHESYHRDILEQLRKESLHGKVVYLGEMLDPMPTLLSTNVLVQCSVIAESFGLSLIEAMAMGKPVIASNSGGPLEIVDDGVDGFLIDPKDIRQRAEILELLCHDRERYKKMGNAARNKVMQRYASKSMADKFSAMYYSLLRTQENSA